MDPMSNMFKHRRISWGAENRRFSWLKQIFMIFIKANTERQIPVIRATLVSAPLASASKYVYECTPRTLLKMPILL